MKLVNYMVTLGCGAVFGIASILSCGDGNPKAVDAADAAMCNCPLAEPPIPARIVEFTTNEVIPANAVHVERGAACPGGPSQTTLNGGCIASLPVNGSIILEQSFPEGIGWTCAWSNPSNVDVPVHVIVRCLKPAQ